MSKNFKILFFYPNEPMVGVASSNLAILTACLKQNEFNDIKLFDCSTYKSIKDEIQDKVRANLGLVKNTNIDNYVILKEGNIYEDFVKTVEEYKPDLIAVTIVDSTLDFSLSFIKKIQDKKIPTIFGGVGATFLYDKILNSGLVDYVCIGEGEETIIELCNGLYHHKDCSQIKNLCFKDKDGNVIKNSMRPLVDLESLPIPDFSIYDDMRFFRPFLGKVVRTLQMDTDRGCPFSCTYCAAPGLRTIFKDGGCGNYYRVKSWDKSFNEMKYLIKKYNLNFVWISSETFLAVSDKKFQEFADRYKKEINLPFWCQSRLDTFTDEKTKLLAEMGCQNISVGLEHGSETIRENMLNKHISNEKILDAIRLMKKYGIFPTLNNMIGLPDETRDDVFQTVKLNREISSILNGHHNVNVFTFIPFSGTKLWEVCIKKGYIDKNTKCDFSYYNESSLNMPSMSKKEIRGLEKTLMLYILLPESYWDDIKKCEENYENNKELYNQLIKISITN